jgi:hypothetical protein
MNVYGPVDLIQDSLKENQTLYNGKIWRNLYYNVMDHQFFLSKEFLTGSLSIKGKTFDNIQLKYDLYKDEILTSIDSGRILQLNKEMIDSFTLSFQNINYRFISMQEDSLKRDRSFFNVLYNGESSLLLKFSKKIDKLADEGKYDKFYQIQKIYFVKGKAFYQITGKNDLFKILPEDKTRIKDFMKKNKLRISGKDPESFIPLIRYYDAQIH